MARVKDTTHQRNVHQGSLGGTTLGHDIYNVTRIFSNKPGYSLQEGEGEGAEKEDAVPVSSVLEAPEGPWVCPSLEGEGSGGWKLSKGSIC